MNKVREFIGRLRGFFAEVGVEMRKISWPERQELVESTVVVIVSVLLLAVFIGLSDKILITILKLLTPIG